MLSKLKSVYNNQQIPAWLQVILGIIGIIIAIIFGNAALNASQPAIPSPPPTIIQVGESLAPSVTNTPEPTDTAIPVQPSITATQTIDYSATATEAILQLTVVAQEATNAVLMDENTQIAASATEAAWPKATDTTSEMPSATFTDTSDMTPTVSATAQSYPCVGTIVSSGSASILNVVHLTQSFSSELRSPVKVGQLVSIMQKAEDSIEGIWYQIAEQTRRILGWIPAEYVSLSPSCPA